MVAFEMILAILLGATLLAVIARRIKVPFPALLALMGIAIALVPGLPLLQIEPELILALLVAPILLDAAHDISWRDLRRNWRPVLSLVLVAVVLTTLAVAWTDTDTNPA
jgi:monovalent cation/hydrogen antiporter